MPTIEKNKEAWDGAYDWPNRGDEWSEAWGTPFFQWHGTLMPRIGAFVPCNRILEIACGYGRWTEYLKDLCDQLIAVDLSEECIQACKSRFKDSPNIEYHQNDGRSLSFVLDKSVDFVFSFDSLVHTDEGVIRAYLFEISRILNDRGVAFIHHSNLGEYAQLLNWAGNSNIRKALLVLSRRLDRKLHWRDPSVDSEKVALWADEVGLEICSQEIVNWGTKRTMIDCFSVLKRKGANKKASKLSVRNSVFMKEAARLKELSRIYGKYYIK